jgi:hypothetical protein
MSVARYSRTFGNVLCKAREVVSLGKQLVVAGLFAATFTANLNAAPERTISIEAYRDKMETGWIGQIAGFAWAARTEFKCYKQIIPINEMTGLPELMPIWTSSLINQTFRQDDLSEFAGNEIDLELYNNTVGDWTKSLAAWKSIDLVS